MGTTSSTTLQSLEEIIQRAPDLGAKVLYVCMFVFVTLRGRNDRSFEGVYFEQVAGFVSLFMGSFDAIFSVFFLERIALSDGLDISHFCCYVAPQFSGNCGQQIVKSSKIGGKVCAHHFV